MITSLLGLLALSACAPVDPDIDLRPFADCDEMTRYMARMARKEVLYDYRWMPELSFLFGAGKGDMALSSGSGASSYSTTNIQEAGVDEADLVKTDGTWLYSLSGTHLVVSRAWPVESLEMVATVALDGDPTGIYLYGDLVVAESTVWGTGAPRSGVRPTHGGDSDPRTLITVVDVSDPTAPVVLREVYASGQFVESRRIDGRLFVVTYQDLSVTVNARNAREARRAVRRATQDDWLPWLVDNRLSGDAWDSEERTTCDCTDVWASDREGGTWVVSVLSMDLDDPSSQLEGSAVVGQAETVYASAGSLYVASSEYVEGPFPSIDSTVQTIIHKFDISASQAHPSYAASAKVLGVLDDRFGLSEYAGVLRVATTEQVGESSAVITTLAEHDGQFELLDSLDGIGAGESIYATRFTGEVGYVVTYQQVDPLFSIDLSDPTNIAVGGSLEMQGWSDYLHPMDDTHLLSVGMGGDWRLQVSLFDVADILQPRLVDQQSLDAYGSESQYEPHAFNYFADQDALALPAWSRDDLPGLEVLVARPDGLSYTGRIDQEELLASFPGAESCAPVRRSVILEDQTVAVSNAGLTVAPLDDPQATVAVAPFTGLDPCERYEYSYPEEYYYY
ncbi:MAG: hypothetical protein GXP62_08570 [Oligoflexia bacterium]|nr:hypothetical protein [Oligoflexia bacterium]